MTQSMKDQFNPSVIIEQPDSCKLESVYVVIPAYNEEICISAVLESWCNQLTAVGGIEFKICVVDDGSRDRTAEIVEALAKNNSYIVLHRQKNGGHGRAILSGYNLALEQGVDWIFQVDSDGQFDPKDFLKLWQLRTRSPFILGQRKSRSDPPLRLIISGLVQFLIKLIFAVKTADANVPFRLMRSDFLKELLSRVPTDVFAPNIFLTVCAKHSGVNLFEIPVTHFARQGGKVSIVRLKLLKVCLRSAWELLKFRVKCLYVPILRASAMKVSAASREV